MQVDRKPQESDESDTGNKYQELAFSLSAAQLDALVSELQQVQQLMSNLQG